MSSPRMRARDRLGVEDAGGRVHGPDLHAGDDGGGSRLVLDDMALLAQDDLAAARAPGEEGELVAEGARGHEEGGFLAHALGGAGLELVDRRVVAVDVVADGGGGHGLPHRGRGPGDGVGAQVDVFHAASVAARRGVGKARLNSGQSADQLLHKAIRALDRGYLHPLVGRVGVEDLRAERDHVPVGEARLEEGASRGPRGSR